MCASPDFFSFPPPQFGKDARKLFFLEEGFVNLNHGSFGALPIPVQDGCFEITKEIERNPDVFMRQKLLERIDDARELVAPMLGADPSTCVFIPNISTGINTVLNNFQWTSSDVIVHTDSVFDSVLLSINRMQTPQKSVFKLPFPLSHAAILQDFRKHLQSVKGSGKVVAIFETMMPLPGIILPWKEMVRICKEEGVWSVVDGAHSIGHELDIDLSSADPDFWMTNCSKWLFTKKGCSILYVPLRNQEIINSTVTPPLTYPTPGKRPSSFVSKFYWNGSTDLMSVLSIEYAIAFRKYIGGEKKINDYCHELALKGGRCVAAILKTEVMSSDRIAEELIGNMVNVSLPIHQSIKPSGEIYLLYQNTFLSTYKMFAPIFYYRGKWWVRISAQIYNDIDDFKKLGENLVVKNLLEPATAPTFLAMDPFLPKFRIPTIERLGVKTCMPDVTESTAAQIAKDWFDAFSSFAQEQNVSGIQGLICEDALWRDLYALTWDIRTFDGISRIQSFLNARMQTMTMHSFTWRNFARLQRPYPDLVWIVVMFGFETYVGRCSFIARLVPTPGGWKAFTLFTNLENLKDFPESIGPSRQSVRVASSAWRDHREQENRFTESNPAVLIVGGGQSGLSLAARLKYLNVPTLVIEKDGRIGDSWRKRYDSLCLHFPIWYDNMPYIPFPPTWPKYSPGFKMADWLEHYADILELNIWTSSTVLDAVQHQDETWTVRVKKPDGVIRVFNVNHFVIATGQGDGVPRMPSIPKADIFRGEILHSSKYKRPTNFVGKKVVVIGTGNSDVTMYQRSATLVMNLDKCWDLFAGPLYSETSPPNDLSDQLSQSIPHLLLEGGLAQRNTAAILASQREMQDALREVGFKLNDGVLGAGILLNLKQKGGGHYFDVGASQLIINGDIKIKSDSAILEYEEHGLKFADGSRLDADVIICATGGGDVRQIVSQLCGESVASECPPFFGVNEEGEMTWFRPFPRKGLWYMHGNLSLTRFHSKHVAMYIKAMEEKLIISRYPSDMSPKCIQLRQLELPPNSEI
ncbi:Hercynylcysteine sulfoxide lyase [Psilocybe cubensis]|uniref:Hercynylcysteine sulfoxide lyase n=1 Tax=Psilocybe cubensis TaxID=181762 RepID=A0ACB8GXB9_PSICU|nr:Hercynylcysteine sulfoxide lyase [Psilocybe cubensis]KAH9480077.1 Hercynylcysteine sulfoxide lyase [Psilocybe cubensis]